MSLVVWLPLNGDLHNQGLSNITVTNNGATVDNNGKIGKCYYFNGSSQYLQLSKSLTNLYAGDFSWAIWLKPTDATRGIIFSEYSSTGASNIAFELLANRVIRVYWAASPDWSTGVSIEQNVWSHVAITRHENTLKVYVNGELKTTKSNATLANKTSSSLIRLGDDYRGGTSVSYMGYMNDARIYDHALSAKEVEEIAKGLVLHYKLDNNGLGNINLVTGSNTSNTSTNKWVGHSAVGGNISTIELDETGIYCVKITRDNTTQSSWDFVSYDNLLRNTIKPATIYTVSFDCKPSVNGSMGLTGFVQGNATNYMTNSTTTIQGTCIANQWNHMIYQCKTINSFDNITIGSQVVYFSRSASLKGTNVTVLFKNIKVEEGSVATPWVPATSDVIYSQFIGDTNIIYDSSGYNNNGTIIGSLETVSDSSRYSCATKFDGNTSGILIENLQLSNIINTAITYSFWIKPKGENGARSIYFGSYSSTSWSIEKTTGNKLRLYWNGSPDETSSAVITDGEWQHIVITKSGTNDIKVYLNRELTWTSTATHNNLTFPTTYRIGRDTRSGDGTPYNGQMSDFRIYATALTEVQVKELYNTSMSIDDKGNIHARELIVEDTNNISTNKRGQLLVNTAEEDAAIASFIKPNKIECDNFYEY